jgi:hypothetical protein
VTRRRSIIALVVGIALAIALLLALVVLGLQAGTTTLSSSEPQLVADSVERGRTMTVIDTSTGKDILCRKMRNYSGKDGKCRTKYVLRATDKYRPGVPPRTTRGGTSYLYCRDWNATARGLFYFNWSERMTGRFCYWTEPRAPDMEQLSMKCGTSSGLGYDITIIECYQTRETGNTTYDWWVATRDRFRVSATFMGYGFHWTHEMWVNQHPTGHLALYHRTQV